MSLFAKNPYDHDRVAEGTPLVNVQVDGEWVQVPKGLNVIEAVKRLGKFIPHYCYHPKLAVVGNCRMCLFEMGMPKLDGDRKPVLDAEGKPEIGWMPRPQIACATQVVEGMGIRTDSALVKECRRGVMEFLLINHPLDCPICDQAGECKLQEFSFEYGQGKSRFVDEKVKKPKRVDIGERIVLDDERCILCSRCIRFAQDFCKEDVLGFTQRGSYTTLGIYPGKRFDSGYSLNAVDICPVGALTSKDFRFKMRVWFLKETPSICTGCATGCNITVGSREGRVYRLTPRVNEAVNSHWMCDAGRLGFHYIHREDRLVRPMVRMGDGCFLGAWEDVLRQVGQRLSRYGKGEVAVVGSARGTLEELYLLRRLARKVGVEDGLLDVVPRHGQGDGILRSADLNPNTRGARLLGFGGDGRRLGLIRDRVAAGEVRVLYVFHEDVVKAGIGVEVLERLELLIVQDILPSETTRLASYILPGASFAEKRGTMINEGRRLQRLNCAIRPPGEAREDWKILSDVLKELGEDVGCQDVEEVFKMMGAELEVLRGMTHGKIGFEGVELDV
ncbi:MAG: molybdopterin-dependent oxidoreductase [Methylacidiphilales bacterium]|nr:molybdopterin-dependent oxidoreductase [Candidatus Methylacidiphilales bacterium]